MGLIIKTMKKNLFIVCITIAMAFVSCNNNEPEGMPVQDGKVSFTIPAPSITANGGNQIGARKITGTLSASSLDFVWEKNDLIEFKFYDANKELLSTKPYVVAETDISSGGASISVSIDAPNDALYAMVTTGPETIPTTQLHKANGIPRDHMRFETDGLIELQPGENRLPMYPIWSVIIIHPEYRFYFEGIYTYGSIYIDADQWSKYANGQIGMDKITLTQTIGTTELNIEYIDINMFDIQQPLKKSGDRGAAPSIYYPIVVYPAIACDLAINLHYNETYFTGESSKDWQDMGVPSFNLILNKSKQQPITTISMHTTDQTVPTIEKGKAYDVDVLRHPMDVYWSLQQ